MIQIMQELENKLKISENTGIHCPTLELTKQVLNIFNDLGLIWGNEIYYRKYISSWDTHKKDTVYYPFDGGFSSLKYAQQNDYKIITAEKFITLHTENNIILLNTTFIQPCIDFNTSEDKNQDFKLGDKVYDIMYKSSGIITNVNINAQNYPLTVKLGNSKIINTYTIDGRVNSFYKTPHLLHYRDDYDYTTIDFKNLPKRQESKRWRVTIREIYF